MAIVRAVKTNSIIDACGKAGGQASLARIIGVSPAMVHQWTKGIRPIAAEHCPSIERATNGAVRCEDLRPDVDWGYLRATDCDVPKVGAGNTAPATEQKAA